MAAAARPGIFARKPTRAIVADASGQRGLARTVGALDLTAFGIATVIGAGIFVIVGEAIGTSGPAIVLSFVLAGVTCLFSALSYAELASTIPVSGSAYTYGYATLGELVAWIIGWDLILEYGLAIAAVAVGWGGYLQELLGSLFGVTIPSSIASPPGSGGVFNLPAVFLVAAMGFLLYLGARETARANTVLVAIKLTVLAFFVVAGAMHIHGGHFTPFAPHGFSGVVDAASVIFFAYIGFDAVSTTSEEARRPGRDVPLAIVGSLLICTVIYIVVALVTTGLAPTSRLAGADAPLAVALRSGGGYGAWATDILSVGALVAIASVVLSLFFGQTRIFFSMARDGLLPERFAQLSSRRTPTLVIVGVGTLCAVLAAFVPLSTLSTLVNIGTLAAFLIVNIGVVVLRATQPDLERPFRVPLSPVFPLIGAALCVYLMTRLSAGTWIRFAVWLAVGLLVYVLYGRTHSHVRRGAPGEAQAASAPTA